MKIVIYCLIFFVIGFAAGTTNTEKLWKDKLKFALEEKDKAHTIMIDVENIVTRKEAFDELLQTLWNTCVIDGGGGFYIENSERKQKQKFKCSREDDNEFTVARR
jgi:hypothetical protein